MFHEWGAAREGIRPPAGHHRRLALLGVDAWEEGDDLFVEGNPALQVPEGLVFESHGDHRLAMTWALVALAGTSRLGDPLHVRGRELPRFSC
ncbi:MAG: hypothetical protein ACLSGS_04025 [Adlercreutzia sp.]